MLTQQEKKESVFPILVLVLMCLNFIRLVDQEITLT